MITHIPEWKGNMYHFLLKLNISSHWLMRGNLSWISDLNESPIVLRI